MSLKRNALTGAAVATLLATPLIANWEGLETQPYRDIGGIWTVCYGETDFTDTGRKFTKSECDELLAQRVPEYYESVIRHIEKPKDVPITMKAALTSFVYNVGEDAYKNSTLLKKLNAGDYHGACDQLDRWVYVSRMYIQGLANRRMAEKRLCVAELPNET